MDTSLREDHERFRKELAELDGAASDAVVGLTTEETNWIHRIPTEWLRGLVTTPNAHGQDRGKGPVGAPSPEASGKSLHGPRVGTDGPSGGILKEWAFVKFNAPPLCHAGRRIGPKHAMEWVLERIDDPDSMATSEGPIKIERDKMYGVLNSIYTATQARYAVEQQRTAAPLFRGIPASFFELRGTAPPADGTIQTIRYNGMSSFTWSFDVAAMGAGPHGTVVQIEPIDVRRIFLDSRHGLLPRTELEEVIVIDGRFLTRWYAAGLGWAHAPA